MMNIKICYDIGYLVHLKSVNNLKNSALKDMQVLLLTNFHSLISTNLFLMANNTNSTAFLQLVFKRMLAR